LENKKFKIHYITNKNDKRIEIDHFIRWDDQVTVFIESNSRARNFCGVGTSMDKEVAVKEAIKDYNKVAPRAFRVTRDLIKLG